MSDPIDNILANLVQYIPTNKGYYMANGDKITFDETVKQIRQQIGRELLERYGSWGIPDPESEWGEGWTEGVKNCKQVTREVCKLD